LENLTEKVPSLGKPDLCFSKAWNFMRKTGKQERSRAGEQESLGEKLE
jgi:hypothetical protein